jgi:hypothetical protein
MRLPAYALAIPGLTRRAPSAVPIAILARSYRNLGRLVRQRPLLKLVCFLGLNRNKSSKLARTL